MPLSSTSALNSLTHPQLAGVLNRMLTSMMGSSRPFGQTITIRRGATTLPAQNVRILHRGGVTQRESETAQEQASQVLVVGDTDLDIAVGDRFNDADGLLYEVKLVRPNRQVLTVAEGEMVQ